MAKTGLEGVYTATNEALNRMEADARKLSRQIEESKASLASINDEKTKAMDELESVTQQSNRLHADLDQAWKEFEARCQARTDQIDALGQALDDREKALDAKAASASQQEQRAGESSAKHTELVSTTRAKVQDLVQQITDAVNALL